MNKNIFCARKGGVTLNDNFIPRRVSDVLAKEMERFNNKMMKRQIKRDTKEERRAYAAAKAKRALMSWGR